MNPMMKYNKSFEELEKIYDEYVIENAIDRRKEIPIVKKFLMSFGIDPTINDDIILDNYTKYDFLAVCLIRSKTKNIPEHLILQFYEYRKSNNIEER